ncbi:30S ribosomal protein S6e [Candidatus Woesearchaeota archaeon]|nr:30S ribosomal protein S6e [Candidatus Woesearchaeota archaeon]
MVGIKVVIADAKKGKCVQKEVSEENSHAFYGKKIGDLIRGEMIDLTGYEFKISGGSDYCGFPMRADVHGLGRRKILLVSGAGAKPYKYKIRKVKPFQFHPGSRQRKTVCGNTIHEKITQVNLLVVKEGAAPLFEEKAEQKAAEAPKQ